MQTSGRDQNSATGGVDANRLRGDFKFRPLEPDPDHAGVGKFIKSHRYLSRHSPAPIHTGKDSACLRPNPDKIFDELSIGL